MLIFMCLWGTSVFAEGYRIEVTIDGVRDTTVYIAIHSGSSKYMVDTARTDGKGRAVFQKSKPLHGGMYLVAMGGMHLFDFLISDDASQAFSMYVKTSDYQGTLRFKGSPENSALLDFQQTMGRSQRQVSAWNDRAKADSTLLPEARDSVAAIEAELKEYARVHGEQQAGTLLASLMRAAFPVVAPAPDIAEDMPRRDSALWVYYYHFNKNHYLDNLDFSDKRLLYTPVFKPKIEDYFDKVVLQHPDSIIPQADYVLRLAEANHEVYNSVLSQLFNKYAEAKIMGMEKVGVYIGEHYFLTGKADWLSDKDRQSIADFVEHNRYSLIGMPAQELKLESVSGQTESVYDIQSPFLALLFYSPSCGHCKKEVPEIYKIYEKYRDRGFQVYAVYEQYKREEWVKFVAEQKLDWINVWDGVEAPDAEGKPTTYSVGSKFREYYNVYTTPQVYLLDKDKKIVGRRLNAEVLDKILQQALGEKESL
jgi:thiol-disulfide isomerase/thioredoxin